MIYIAAPFAADPDLWTARVSVLSRWLTSLGLHPVSVHAAIQAGAYGDDADPASRARGIQAACALVRLISQSPNGSMVIITQNDGTLSPGCRAEMGTFAEGKIALVRDVHAQGGKIDMNAQSQRLIAGTWGEWCAWMEEGNLPKWSAKLGD